jgi:hypothetical protein
MKELEQLKMLSLVLCLVRLSSSTQEASVGFFDRSLA